MATKADMESIIAARHPDADEDTRRFMVDLLWEAHLDGKTIGFQPAQTPMVICAQHEQVARRLIDNDDDREAAQTIFRLLSDLMAARYALCWSLEGIDREELECRKWYHIHEGAINAARAVLEVLHRG